MAAYNDLLVFSLQYSNRPVHYRLLRVTRKIYPSCPCPPFPPPGGGPTLATLATRHVHHGVVMLYFTLCHHPVTYASPQSLLLHSHSSAYLRLPPCSRSYLDLPSQMEQIISFHSLFIFLSIFHGLVLFQSKGRIVFLLLRGCRRHPGLKQHESEQAHSSLTQLLSLASASLPILPFAQSGSRSLRAGSTV